MPVLVLIRRSLFYMIASLLIAVALLQIGRIAFDPAYVFNAQSMPLGTLIMVELFVLFRQRSVVFELREVSRTTYVSGQILLGCAAAMPLIPIARDPLLLVHLPVGALFVSALGGPFQLVAVDAAIALTLFIVGPDAAIGAVRLAYLVTAVVSCPAGVALVRMAKEQHELNRKLDHASWAASELSNLTMRIDRTVYEERRKTSVRERKRIAQDLHDNVGHSLTALIGLVDQFRNNTLPPEAEARVTTVEEYLRDTLRQVREEVDELRRPRRSWSERQDWTTNVLRLCDVFGECTRVNVETQNVSLEQLPMEAGEEVFHVVQECLANSYRHGHAENVLISSRLDTERKVLMVKVSDDGYGAPSLTPGNGLTGMQERIARFGGEIEWKSIEGSGFDVAVEIPLEGGQLERQP